MWKGGFVAVTLVTVACGGGSPADGGADVTTSDTGGGDATNDAPKGDSGGDALAALFPCGNTLMCDATIQYCQLMTGPPTDGGNQIGQCVHFPPSCSSCSCLPANPGCMCAPSGADITVTCS